jgi:hypothetical protein
LAPQFRANDAALPGGKLVHEFALGADVFPLPRHRAIHHDRDA